MCYTGVAGGWGLAPRSAGLGAQGTLVDRYTRAVLLVTLAAPLGSIGRAARRSAAPQGGAPDSLYIRLALTGSEAPVVAAALDEYRKAHDLHRLYDIRLQQLADQLRDAHAALQARDRPPA